MKVMYLVKKEEALPYAKCNWIMMNSAEFHAFLETEEGKRRKKDFGRLYRCSEDDCMIVAECGYETAKLWDRENKYRAYWQKATDKAGVSYFTDIEAGIGRDMLLGEVLPDDTCNLENTVEQKHLVKALYAAIETLPGKDKVFLFTMFFSDKSMTTRECAHILGISEQAAGQRKKVILSKLRKLLENWS